MCVLVAKPARHTKFRGYVEVISRKGNKSFATACLRILLLPRVTVAAVVSCLVRRRRKRAQAVVTVAAAAERQSGDYKVTVRLVVGYLISNAQSS